MFSVALFSAVIMGSMQAMGETINLGLMKTFPGDCIGYYSAGTGFGKLFAASIVIVLTLSGLSNGIIYLIGMATAIPYRLSFNWINKQKELYPYVPDAEETMKESDEADGPKSEHKDDNY